MWFNRGSGGSSARLNRLPHGFTPACLRCLCTMDPESLGKALQDCLRALGTGQGFSNPHAAEEALKERRAQKQEAIDEEGKKTMEDSPSYSPLEEKEVTPAPEAEAEKDSDNGVPVPTPPVIPEPKDTEKHIPVPSPPEVPEPKESEEQVVKEEKVESAGPAVQEHQHSGEDSPAAPVGQEEIEEVGEAPKDEEMPACKQEDNEEAAPEVGAPVPHVKEEPLPND